MTDPRNVNGFENPQQAFDIGTDIRDNQGVGRRVGENYAALGDERGKQPFYRIGIGIPQGNNLRDDRIARNAGFFFPSNMNSSEGLFVSCNIPETRNIDRD